MPNQPMSSVSSASVVMDVLPWPKAEHERLDDLLGLALLDPGVQDRLIVQHDPALLDAFNLSEDTRHWLSTIQARSLKEFAQAIVAALNPSRGYATREAA